MRILDYRQLVDTFFRRAATESIADVLRDPAITVMWIPVSSRYFESANPYGIAIGFGISDRVIPVDFRCIMPEANCIKRFICIPFPGINPVNGHPVFVLYFSAYKIQREDDFLNIPNDQLESDYVHGPRCFTLSAFHLTSNSHFPLTLILLSFWTGHGCRCKNTH